MPDWKIICEYLRVNRNVGLAKDVEEFAKRQEAIDAATAKLVEAVQREIAWLREESTPPGVSELEDALAELKEASK